MEVIPKESYIIENNVWTFGYKWSVFNFGNHINHMKSPRFSSGLHNIRDQWYILIKYGNIHLPASDCISIHIYLESLGVSELSVKVKYSIESSGKVGNFESPTFTEENIQPGSSIDFGENSILTSSLLKKNQNSLQYDHLHISCEIQISLDPLTRDLSVRHFNQEGSDLLSFNDVSQLSNSMALALGSGKYSDVIFKVGKKSFKVMRGILAARSRVLAEMFEHHKMLNNHMYLISISDVREEVFKELLFFIYTDTSPKIESMPVELLVVAEKYQLLRLKNMCEEVIIGNMVADNVLGFFVFANMCNAANLRRRSIEFIRRNLKAVSRTEEFQAMKESNAKLSIEILEGMAEFSFP